MESLIESLPSIIIAAIAMVVGAGLTLWVANRSGIGEISQAVDRENDRLVAAQAQRIKLLEKRVEELERELELEKRANKDLIRRIDLLEKLVSDEQIRKVLHD